MRFLAFSALTLVLLAVESALVKALGLEAARVHVGLAVVVFVALRGGALEGAFTAFAAGYLVDVFTGRPTGLYPFLAVLVFLLVRGAAQLVDGRSRRAYGLFLAGAAFGHALLVAFFTWLTSRQGGGVAWAGLPLQLALTTGVGVALWPLFRRLAPGVERAEAGSLR